MARALAVVAVMALAVFGMASAATYNVGEPGGSWDLRTNYTNWIASKRFQPGDKIVFKYSPQVHDVLEVNKAAYDTCNTDNEIATLTSGNDVISLDRPGTRYFICGFPNHCTGGMKIQIDVVPGATSMAPAGAPGTSPSTPSTPGSSATTIKATAAGFGLAAVMLAAGLIA
ncbi:hypothetical protein QOZ80_6BG0478480 [Eleusine coracana subsp. coracana]|nr:hypothetical protein QOZ80_6BG0478480 [Eleusine coracana subsp. coracana]